MPPRARPDPAARSPRNDAFDQLDRYLLLHDSILDSDRIKAVTEMREKYETEKKERDNVALRAANLEAALDQEQLRRTRNLYLFGGIMVLVGAIALWSRLRFVHRSRAAIRKEKDISEALLHNILPEEVAAELKQKGYADVKEFEVATILFSDFKGFTVLSERLTAAELVAEIDHCFKGFDAIMEQHGIEKIKTIGDAYMAAGGLPIPAHGRPAEVVRAALAMQDFMADYKARREAEGRLFFEMRLGLHTGPVIAGIVGVKKFAYDIWGDTVNTASRMESSGAPGRVNISRATYERVKDEPDLRFVPRGEVEAKGKGMLEMWFVERS
ncbi:MAG: adenylate/guanylate cyclase domain-containing protein [Flavobacteriales bacterium]|nr:adenylate/guanylate cyclase domain-containing protein [Flavobacteriales bacterium]